MKIDGRKTYIETGDMHGTSPFIGLCAVCTQNRNSMWPIRVSSLTRGWPADMFGEGSVVFPSGNTITEWRPDVEVPPGGEWLSEIALTFGPDIRFVEGSGFPLPMFAVTERNGWLVCESHNANDIIDHNRRRV